MIHVIQLPTTTKWVDINEITIVLIYAQVNTTVLWLNNPQIDNACGNVYIGEVLCVHNGVKVPEYNIPEDAPVHSINDVVDWSNSPVANAMPVEQPETDQCDA